MVKKLVLIIVILFSIESFSAPVYALWTWTPKTGWMLDKDIAKQSPKAQWDYARNFEKKKQYGNAVRAYKVLSRVYPTSGLSALARQRIALCYQHNGDFYKAFKAYQDLIENCPKKIDFEFILEKEYQIGMLFVSGKKMKLWKFPILPARDKGIEILKTVVNNAPYSKIAPHAQFNIGTAYKKLHKLDKAIAAYNKVIEDYKDSPWYKESFYQIGLCNYIKSRGSLYNQAASKKSADIFHRFLNEFPNSNHTYKAKDALQKLEGRQANGILNIARFYERGKHKKAAVMYYKDVIKKFPGTKEAAEAKKKLEKLEK